MRTEAKDLASVGQSLRNPERPRPDDHLDLGDTRRKVHRSNDIGCTAITSKHENHEHCNAYGDEKNSRSHPIEKSTAVGLELFPHTSVQLSPVV
jgi:hypothetical protein